jgi:tRNA(Arg) A34 adenosine deaminase TadA
MSIAHADDIALLHRTIEIAAAARATGNHPFGALLAGPDGEILIEGGNAFATEKGPGHAENLVARQAAVKYEPDFLARCTLVTSVEPCAMCAGATYWAGIVALVFGITERKLLEMTCDNPENLTMDLPCRTVFAAGQRETDVRGPYPEVEAEIAKGHEGFW